MILSPLSREYVKVKVTATEDGAPVDPTADTVEMAFTVDADPESDDWKAAEWETANGSYYARCLVGPSGTVSLAEGTYTVWVRVTDNPEQPVLRAGSSLVVK